jgi:hypothetical protein
MCRRGRADSQPFSWNRGAGIGEVQRAEVMTRSDEGARTGILFEDHFDGPVLDEARWMPAYLPHWSSLEASRPTYDISGSVLTLTVGDNQRPWCPEFDGAVRVSNLQTGHYSGRLGSTVGQHRFREGLRVREHVPARRLFLDRFFRLEMLARARLGATHLAALWLIGYEDTPERSGEITVMEVFGKDADETGTVLGHGIKQINDPNLTDDFAAPRLRFDVSDWHLYAIDWRPDCVAFSLDGRVLTRSSQSPGYPMQLMLNLYDIPTLATDSQTRATLSPAFDVDYIRAWRD